MTAENQNAEVPAGDSHRLVIPNTTAIAGQVVDLSLAGAALTWTMGRTARGAVLITKTLGSGIAIDGSVATVTIDKADTAEIPPGTYYHQLRAVFSDGTRETLTRGSFRITPTM